MARLSASVVRDFTVPAADNRPSPHGSQREDAILALYLPGWLRECSDAAYAAMFPNVTIAHEGNSRGRGRTGADGFRVNPSRSCGMDALSLKAPKVRGDGTCASAHDMFHGPVASGAAFIAAVQRNYGNRKAFPVAVTHTTGDTFAPVLVEWCVRDFGHMLATVTNAEGWPLWNGIPVKPVNDRKRGAGGSPASVWVVRERREYLGDGKAKYIPDENGTYVRIVASFSQRSGAVFKSGTPAQFAADVDAATVLR